ncbi:MAG: hypothetical protein IH969_09610, partial [Candidatus Krumholzibacteriota bacterium]|nr:hypothetical protein [Candidatus Krumholzibacteriota bacterium]
MTKATTKTRARRKSKASKPDEQIARALALGLYCDFNGDIDQTYKALKRKRTKKTLLEWEDQYNWRAKLGAVGDALTDLVLYDAVQRKDRLLTELHQLREHHMANVLG